MSKEGIHGYSREQRLELVRDLFARQNAPADAVEAFRKRFRSAPDEMIKTAVHHIYVDGAEAVLDWLADAELFLRDQDHGLSYATSFHLLYHVYNWHMFQVLLPEGKTDVLDLVKELKQHADDNDLESMKRTVDELEERLTGGSPNPDFDYP